MHDLGGHDFQIEHAHDARGLYLKQHEQCQVSTGIGQQQGGGHGADDMAAHDKFSRSVCPTRLLKAVYKLNPSRPAMVRAIWVLSFHPENRWAPTPVADKGIMVAVWIVVVQPMLARSDSRWAAVRAAGLTL